MTKKGIVLTLLFTLGTVGFVALMVYLAGDPALLNPKGPIARHQRDLFLLSTALMLIVVLPVFALAGYISVKYRAGNTGNDYRPNWDDNKYLEMVWWGIPIILVIVLSVIAWRTSHSLDPYRQLTSDSEPVNVQVLALQWKWLFIYPDYRVAVVNELPVPSATPINFLIGADAPMNSFWIPELGGQIYAMNGMSTKLHLQADQAGDYKGYSSNISGEGFAKMEFMVKARQHKEFVETMKTAGESDLVLDMDSYNELAKPSIVDEPMYYRLGDNRLYDKVIEKYLHGGHSNDHDRERGSSY